MEPLVEKVILESLSGEEFDLALGALEKIKERAQELEKQWENRLEAARYEADKAARRYYQVEPENRLVSRTLEREWNERLEEIERLQQEYRQVREQVPFTISDEQRERILALAHDLPALWQAPTTPNSQRKQLLRILIEDVTLLRKENGIDVSIRWKTGLVTSYQAKAAANCKTSVEVIGRLEELYSTHTDPEIAKILNSEGHKSAHDKKFTPGIVAHLRNRKGHPKNYPEIISRIEQLYKTHTDQEIADLLNAEGYKNRLGKTISASCITHIRCRRGLPRPLRPPMKTPLKVIKRIEQLYRTHTDREIAEILNTEGYKSGFCKKFTRRSVGSIRHRQGFKKL